MAIFCSFRDGAGTVEVNGKTVHFEFSYRFGPLLTDSRGEPLSRQPTNARDHFWPPFERWLTEWSKTHPDPAKAPRHSAQMNRDPQP